MPTWRPAPSSASRRVGNPRRFVSASADGTLRLWDMSLSRPNLRSYTLSRSGGSEQGSLPVTVSFPNAVDASFHTFFLAGFSGGEVCRFDVATGDATVYTAHGGGSGGGVTGMCAVPLGGTCVFASHADGSLSLFDVGRTPPAAAATVLAHGEGCSSAAVAPNGLQVATGSPSGWVRLWDARQLGAHLSEAPMHDPRAGEGVLQLAFAPPLGPTGKPGAAAAPGSQSLPILASAGADGVVQLLALPG
uniref:Uncharacterized protein n=1 Tax=Tetraselmis sp. GSL018 TaxID=582737 RepID=A0A061S7I8_9CHLO